MAVTFDQLREDVERFQDAIARQRETDEDNVLALAALRADLARAKQALHTRIRHGVAEQEALRHGTPVRDLA